MELEQFIARYPRTIALKDGDEVEVRVMGRSDGAAVLEFARSLPQEDVMFLRIDITQPETVEAWLRDIDAGLVTSLAAYDGPRFIGYASVRRDPTRWLRRVGELRANIDPGHRSKGLGRALLSQVFELARSLDLRKITANMTDGQPGTQAVLRQLGFVPEAVLAEFVEDRAGNLRDLVVMVYDVKGSDPST